jgi:hypothetical protein
MTRPKKTKAEKTKKLVAQTADLLQHSCDLMSELGITGIQIGRARLNFPKPKRSK